MQLVETGKALRAARKDGRGTSVPARDPPGKMSESIRTFHQALNTLEQDIVSDRYHIQWLSRHEAHHCQVSAKSVLQRDLKRIRDKSGQAMTPQVDMTQFSSFGYMLHATCLSQYRGAG